MRTLTAPRCCPPQSGSTRPGNGPGVALVGVDAFAALVELLRAQTQRFDAGTRQAARQAET